jgi:hypothetical protein
MEVSLSVTDAYSIFAFSLQLTTPTTTALPDHISMLRSRMNPLTVQTSCNRACCFCGGQGTGKTLTARNLAGLFYGGCTRGWFSRDWPET